jgi:hypothetical protein
MLRLDVVASERLRIEMQFLPPQRDLRLDLFRGIANWAMFLGHVPGSVLAWCSFRNYGFSDGADLFVFISGYTSALVFGRKMAEGGFAFGTSRLLRRVWQIYVAHVLLFVIYLASVHYLSGKFSAPDWIDQFNVGPLLASPVDTITQGLLLRYKPLNLDVLPLYVVLMGAFPSVLWLMLRYRNWIMAGSVLVYFAARQFGWNLPSYPSGVWYFNPFAWQLLFILGAWLALGGANMLHFLVRSRAVMIFGLAYLLFAAAMTMAAQIPELQKLLPRALFEAFNPNDKTNLAPYRFLHLAVLIILGARFIPIDAAGLQAALWKPVIKCGQQSLEVFAVGICLSFLGYFVLQTTASGVIAQLLVGSGGISIMTAVAYYRSWSKRVEKQAHGHANQPAVHRTPALASEPVQPGEKMVVSAA